MSELASKGDAGKEYLDRLAKKMKLEEKREPEIHRHPQSTLINDDSQKAGSEGIHHRFGKEASCHVLHVQIGQERDAGRVQP